MPYGSLDRESSGWFVVIQCLSAGKVMRGALKHCTNVEREQDGLLRPPAEPTPSLRELSKALSLALMTGHGSEKQDFSKLDNFVNQHLVVISFKQLLLLALLSNYLMPSVCTSCFSETWKV